MAGIARWVRSKVSRQGYRELRNTHKSKKLKRKSAKAINTNLQRGQNEYHWDETKNEKTHLPPVDNIDSGFTMDNNPFNNPPQSLTQIMAKRAALTRNMSNSNKNFVLGLSKSLKNTSHESSTNTEHPDGLRPTFTAAPPASQAYPAPPAYQAPTVTVLHPPPVAQPSALAPVSTNRKGNGKGNGKGNKKEKETKKKGLLGRLGKAFSRRTKKNTVTSKEHYELNSNAPFELLKQFNINPRDKYAAQKNKITKVISTTTRFTKDDLLEILIKCIKYLYENQGHLQEGIFRQVGNSTSNIYLLLHLLNNGTFDDLGTINIDTLCVADVIKIILIALNDSKDKAIIPQSTLDQLLELNAQDEHFVANIANILAALSLLNKKYLLLILTYLKFVNNNNSINKMTINNIAKVLVQSIFEIPKDTHAYLRFVTPNSIQIQLLENILTNWENIKNILLQDAELAEFNTHLDIKVHI